MIALRLLLIVQISFLICCDWFKRQENKKDPVHLSWSISPNPPKVGPIEVTLHTIAGAEIDVEGNMSHPGMTPLYTKANESKAGAYSFKLNLNMAGDWVFFLKIKSPDGVIEERSIPLSGVK
jgi:hypothetical protein